MGAIGDGGRPRPGRLDRRLAGPGRHRHDQPGRRPRCSTSQPRRRRAAPARAADRLLRPHRRRAWSRSASLDVETTGTTTYLPDLPVADLHLLNDGDLTFAACAPTSGRSQVLLDRGRPAARRRSTARSRSAPPGTCWPRASCRPATSSTACWPCWRPSRAPAWSSRSSTLALRAAEQWSPARAGAPPAGPAGRGGRGPGRRARAPHRRAAHAGLGGLASPSTSSCSTRRRPTTSTWPGGSWSAAPRSGGTTRRRSRSCSTATPTRTPTCARWGVSAARPVEEAKAEAWERVWRDRAVPAGPDLIDFARCFWRPVQHELLVPWAHRYLDEVDRAVRRRPAHAGRHGPAHEADHLRRRRGWTEPRTSPTRGHRRPSSAPSC